MRSMCGDLTQEHLSVVLAPQDIARIGGAMSPSREHARRHLVEQRLEQVMVRPIDNRHVDRRAAEGLRRPQPAEPRADDHGAVPGGQLIHLFAYHLGGPLLSVERRHIPRESDAGHRLRLGGGGRTCRSSAAPTSRPPRAP